MGPPGNFEPFIITNLPGRVVANGVNEPSITSSNLTAFGIIADPSLDADGLKALRKRLAAIQPNLEVRTTKPRKAEPSADSAEENRPPP
jgi:hypothetical protein